MSTTGASSDGGGAKQELSLYVDPQATCAACGMPPKENIPLKSCTRCKSVSYHDKTCQENHWKTGHKRQCHRLTGNLRPLLWLVEAYNNHGLPSDDTSPTSIPRDELERMNFEWSGYVDLWYQQDYLGAMQGFQDTLQPFMLDNPASLPHTNASIWAARLLFCAYCELDGQESDPSFLNLARQRLVRSIYLLLLVKGCSALSASDKSVLQDAWTELVLSYEEDNDMSNARHVAHLSVETSSGIWQHPYRISDPDTWLQAFYYPHHQFYLVTITPTGATY